jgi:S1-C subfamily serine protease
VNAFLAKIVAWITAGYPEGVPGPDRVPLMSLLNRRLTNDEVKAVAHDLLNRGEFDHIDIGVLITQMTDELPQEDVVERIRERLAAKGWPLDDPRDDEESA